jgi:hypothetical protein
VIPNCIHFCCGFSNPPTGFLFVHYLAVKSASLVNAPEEITLSYSRAPGGVWWERVQPYVRPIRIEPPTTIFGRPLKHFVHQADVFRLRKLLDEGGIYLDIDTLCLRPFLPLLNREMVMARQTAEGYGLCNAVMLAQPGARFLRAWLWEYRYFRSQGHDQFWDEHAVRVPLQLLCRRDLRDAITVLPYTSFFYPDYHETERLFVSEDVTPWANAYSVHLWETVSMAALRSLTPAAVRSGRSAYCRMARPFLNDET